MISFLRVRREGAWSQNYTSEPSRKYPPKNLTLHPSLKPIDTVKKRFITILTFRAQNYASIFILKKLLP